MAKWAAGLLLSSALAITGMAQAAPDCKSSWGNAACPAPKTINPPPSAKPAMTAKSGAAMPKPRPEPGVVRRAMPPGSSPKTAASNSSSHQSSSQVARHATQGRSHAQNARAPERERRETWRAFDAWRAQSAHSYASPGRVYGYAPQVQVPAGGLGCADTCQYREWLERYRTWYDRYGRDYGAGRDLPPMASAADPDEPAHESENLRPPYRQSGMRMNPSERDRLDPWHGYDSRDGLENGY